MSFRHFLFQKYLFLPHRCWIAIKRRLLFCYEVEKVDIFSLGKSISFSDVVKRVTCRLVNKYLRTQF